VLLACAVVWPASSCVVGRRACQWNCNTLCLLLSHTCRLDLCQLDFVQCMPQSCVVGSTCSAALLFRRWPNLAGFAVCLCQFWLL
jgi:hypothetical protein